jgi:signal transduction histidine kinase/CheY-like chemotaxis protein
MKDTIPFFNWFLTKVLATEPDSLKKARISIIFVIIILSFIKLLIALPAAVYNQQNLQITRIIFFMGILALLLRFLLKDSKYAGKIGVILIWLALILNWTNVFITAQTLNIVTIQVVVMIILSSFYLLNWRWALVYSFLSILPVTILMALGEGTNLTRITPDELASPSYEIIVVLNFLTIIIAHFLYYQALNKNVHEKEILNQQLQQAVKEANLAVQSKADFLSTMSHELRTPLNSVIGMTQLLLNSPYGTEQAENLKIVNFSAMNLHMLINDILDFNKMESDKLNLEAIDVDLYSLISDICSGMRFQAEEKGLELEVNIDNDIRPHQVITDPTRLTQIIHNLVGNAIKFTHSGKVVLSLKIIEFHPDCIAINFSVADTGIGISNEQQEVIFEAFTQASSSTTRNFGGTGLGLTIVKRLLKLFDSDIRVSSIEGRGSEFFFDIYFKTTGTIAGMPNFDKSTVYDLKNLSILVVEDNPINSLLIKKIFSSWNNQPDFATNGYEAIEKLEVDSYDVILMDIHMPLLDGYETARLIRSMSDVSRSSTPIIALTASVSNDLFNKIKDAGMDDYINKPFNSDDLYRKLKAIRSPKLVAENS